MEREQFIRDLKHILIKSAFLDISAYLISVFFIGFTFSMAAGLFLGTAGMTVNLILLNLVVGAVIAAAVHIPFVNTAGAVIPFFYPQLVFAGNVLLRKGEKTE